MLLGATVIGFRLFYFHAQSYPGRPITPPIRSLIVAHGVVMSAWMLLFLAQPFLVAVRNVRTHMALGRVGAVLAALLTVLGVVVAIQSAHVMPPEARIWGMNAAQFLSVPLISVLLFGALVGIAVWKRKRPEIHRALMFTATLGVVDAAVSRIDPVSNIFLGSLWEHLFGPFFGMLMLGAALLAVRCILIRAFDRWLAIGLGLLTLTSALTVFVAHTSAWESFAGMLIR